MGDVVSIGTKQVVQVADDRPPSGSLSEPEDDLIMDADAIGEFIGLAAMPWTWTRTESRS